jgi:hypothetical protein
VVSGSLEISAAYRAADAAWVQARHAFEDIDFDANKTWRSYEWVLTTWRSSALHTDTQKRAELTRIFGEYMTLLTLRSAALDTMLAAHKDVVLLWHPEVAADSQP